MKKKTLILSAILLAFVLAVLFFFLLLYGPNFGIYLRKPSPQAYGERALAFMENGYYSSAEEWREAKASAQDALRAAQSYEDTWPILREALSAAGGKHSRLITPAEKEEAREDPISLPLVSTDSMEHGIVTLVIPEFTQGAEQAQEYAQIVLSWLREHQDAAGVILDLRVNRGGDLAPMICALSPLLPDGPLLGVRYANGQMNTMTLADGAFSGGSEMKVESFKMLETIPIAILTDEWKTVKGSYSDTEHVKFRTLPEVTVASCIYQGSYTQITEVYAAVIAWMEANGYEPSAPMFNIYHVSPHETQNPDEFVTEICYPVKKK